MSLLAVGALAYDTVETPSGRVEDILGGAATYFAVGAAFFGPVRLVGVVGEDFKHEHRKLLEESGVLLDGLEVRKGKTFRWSGRYAGDMNVAETMATHLNVLDGYEPTVPEAFRKSKFVFLANAPPRTQAHVLDQVPGAFTVLDTMNYWIQEAWDDLNAVLKRVDMLVCNDQEARAIAEDHSLIRAGRKLLAKGPKVVVVKKGEHGAFLWGKGFFHAIPAYPLEHVVDPTGAGDSFAGGLVGSLAAAGKVDERSLRRAMIHGAIVASFTVEDFSLRRLRAIARRDVDARYEEFLGFTAHP
ncbi:MAG TPA: PfkB family carbohydrate kinase [Planctomycetota bacterium]|nr:PfkB family carbohydrate kinase [Planctomycetota bacterium]